MNNAAANHIVALVKYRRLSRRHTFYIGKELNLVHRTIAVERRRIDPSAAPVRARRPGSLDVGLQDSGMGRVGGVSLAGVSTTGQPAARAGASFQAAISSGKFQGMI